MTDTVPHIVYADDISKIAVCLGQDATSTQACLAFSSESAHNRFYLNESWVLERHLALDPAPVPHLFLREDAIGATTGDFNILGTIWIRVHRQGAAPARVRASVFRPRQEMCVTLILSARMLPRAVEPPARTKVRISAPKSEEIPGHGGSLIGSRLEYPSY
jgi:hypothetical protein